MADMTDDVISRRKVLLVMTARTMQQLPSVLDP